MNCFQLTETTINIVDVEPSSTPHTHIHNGVIQSSTKETTSLTSPHAKNKQPCSGTYPTIVYTVQNAIPQIWLQTSHYERCHSVAAQHVRREPQLENIKWGEPTRQLLDLSSPNTLNSHCILTPAPTHVPRCTCTCT